MAKTPKKQSKGWWQQQNYTNPKKAKSIENKSKQKFLSQECKCLFVISLYLKSKNANKTNDDENTLSQEDREWWKKNLNKHKHLFEMIDWNYEQPIPNRQKYGKRNNKKPFCLMSVSKTNIKRKTWKSFQFKVPLFSLHCTRKLFGIYVCRTSTFVRYFHCSGFFFLLFHLWCSHPFRQRFVYAN